MKQSNHKVRLLLLLMLPWFFAEAISHHPLLSYLLAFVGSFYVFYLTIFSSLNGLDQTLPRSQQVMRPMILLQLIFAGFMSCTSIFYFMDHLGYYYLTRVRSFEINEQSYLIAQCQRLALLAHIALVTGIHIQQKKVAPRYRLSIPLNVFLFYLSLVLWATVFILKQLTGLHQLSIYLITLASSTQMLLLIRGFDQRKFRYVAYGLAGVGLILYHAALTGYKESFLAHFFCFAFLAIPYSKKVTSLVFIPIALLLVYILPTFTTVIRMRAWTENKAPQMAGLLAYQTVLNGDNAGLIKNNNWAFLTLRLSEIDMHGQYLRQIPVQQPYYGLQILKHSMTALVPRALWHQKPDTEKQAMERVYKAGVVDRSSPVSAKTRPAMDGYLSAGLPGVFISMLCYGMLSQWLCNQAELRFGGYQLGCALLFNSLFQQLWRGNNWEFLINNIVYGTLILFALFQIFIFLNLLKPYSHDNHSTCNTRL